MRVGLGFDIHAFCANRRLIIGGVEIPYSLGLKGHSDADVLVHAVVDALLGAIGERDIGFHFPDTDPAFKDISSLHILRRVAQMVSERGYMIGNIDSVVMAQNPRLSPYIKDMCKIIAAALDISEGKIMVKATSTESLGFVGRGEGIAAQAICIVIGNGNGNM